MSRFYQQEVQERITVWISKYPEKYSEMVRAERTGISISLIGSVISAGIILGLFFKVGLLKLGVYVMLSVAVILYKAYISVNQGVQNKIRLGVFKEDKQLEEGYINEVTSHGLAGKMSERTFRIILLVFGLGLFGVFIVGKSLSP